MKSNLNSRELIEVHIVSTANRIKLSRRELETWIYIKNFFDTQNRMPTHNELKIDLGLTSNGFRNRILEKLEDCGYIMRVTANQIAYRIVIR